MDKPMWSALSEGADEDGTTAMDRDMHPTEVDMDDLGEELEESEPAGPSEFDENLAAKLTPTDKASIGLDLKHKVEYDIQSRADWERKLVDGMSIIGINDVPTDRTAFDGAAAVNHPALAEAMVQFQARAMEELMPPGGPVKASITGKSTPEREEQRERVENFMNYQLTEEDDEYYSDTDNMLFYLPYAGSAFKKVAPSPISSMTRSRFIRSEDFIVPYSASSLYTAPRYSHRYSMSRNDYLRAVDSGYFIDGNLPESTGVSTEQDQHRELQDKSDERMDASPPDDTNYTFCETHCDMEFDWETYGNEKKFKLPYAITWEWETGTVIRIARIWGEEDADCKKEVWFTHHKYLPGLGFYGFGLLHIIGSLGRAAGGALRAVLDGSTTASLQGGFKSRDARIAGDVTFTPGVWADVDMTAEELAKSFYTPPFKEPSPALFKTLELLVTGIQRFTSTTEAMVGDASNTGPVGTTVALIEQGSKVFSGIHRRLHQAARQEFKLIAKANFRYMEMDAYPYDVGGEERQILKSDFDGRVDIVPVSDPNIFSSTQRIAIAQATAQDVDANPDIYSRKDKIRAHKTLLKALRNPEVDEYLKEGQVKRMDPVTENQVFMTGGGGMAFAEQDHGAHVAVHTPILMQLEAKAQQGDQEAGMAYQALKAHITEHEAWDYRLRVSAELAAKTGIPLPPFDPADPESYEELPPDVENAIALAVVQLTTPPPPPQAPEGGEAAKDEAASREQDRKDMASVREQQRKDAAHKAELRRDGIEEDPVEEGAIPM
jgi:chaperonin GroES